MDKQASVPPGDGQHGPKAFNSKLMDARGRKLIQAGEVNLIAIQVFSLSVINAEKQEVKYEFMVLSQVLLKAGGLEAGGIMCYLVSNPQFLLAYFERKKVKHGRTLHKVARSGFS